ncbi:MAG TPA: hypothetical protein VLY03_05135 [Bacteroidota bacterium]|nr:hypothetical protein [Bacteroidota bacterium]
MRIQQRFFFLIFGVGIIGLAFTVGIGQFGANNVQVNKIGVTTRLSAIAANIFEFQSRSMVEWGKGKSFVGYIIPRELAFDSYGRYNVEGLPSRSEIKLTAQSAFDPAWSASMIIDSSGNSSIRYFGWE